MFGIPTKAPSVIEVAVNAVPNHAAVPRKCRGAVDKVPFNVVLDVS
jgi:hypothetical protein